MAVNPNTLILKTDQFLLNRDGGTFKTPFENLAENVLNLVIDPDGDGTNNSLIFLNDLGDVDIQSFVKERAPTTGNPQLIGKIGPQSDGTDVNLNSKFWILQHVDSRVPREDGQTQESRFILADPSDAFREAADQVVGNLELNRLLDVTTRLDGSEIPGATAGPFLPHSAGDSFLLCVKEGSVDQLGEVIEYPDYQPRSISATISNIINQGPSAPGGGIQIDLETIIDVNPIYIDVGPIGSPELEAVSLRLEVTQDFKNGVPDAPKYVPVLEAKHFDDILVYLTGQFANDNYDPTGLADLNLVDKDGNERTTLPAGWYYAENIGGGDNLEPAGLANADVIPETEGQNVTLGGVRVLKFRDTELIEDPDMGGLKVASVGQRPTNINITSEGVLYSEIPSTLRFNRTIEIVGDVSGGLFYTDGNGATVDGKGLPAAGEVENVKFNYLDEATTGTSLQYQGPGSYETPDVWNNLTANPPVSLPAVGDFYVIQFVDRLNADGSVLQPKNFTATLEWNDNYPQGNTTSGPDLQVENGDIVAFGPSGWSVIGSVNTETIAQDLQDVTERGNFTNQGINLQSGLDNGLLVGRPLNKETASIVTTIPSGGVVATSVVQANKIDFDFIADLADAPTA